MKTFEDLDLSREILESLKELDFLKPTPIQAEAIPHILKSDKDLIALAQTGTGKTAAFALPIIQKIDVNSNDLQAIIICPVRELCLQIFQDIKKFSKNSKNLSSLAVYGGERIDLQIGNLKKGVNIVIGTPGRIHDLIRRKVLKLQKIQYLVLDEADEMLDMGFKEDLDAILEQTPTSRQTLLFSATMSKSVYAIAQKYMKSATEISIGAKNIGAENVQHEYYITAAKDRFEALRRILDYLPGVYGILFCRTRNETQIVADKLKQSGYDAEALHGEISQTMRGKIMDRFKKKNVRLLVATDVAARGIDVSNLSHVINYNLPDQDEGYTHRSGRTGRADKKGVSISILSPRESSKIKALEKIIGKEFELKKIPGANDIHKKQIDDYVKKIQEADIEKIGNHKYSESAIEDLMKEKKEDLIKKILVYKFDSLLNTYKNSTDLNAKAGRQKSSNKKNNYNPENNYEVKINFGKKHNLDIKKIFSIINSDRSSKRFDVGRIKILPNCTYISVDKKNAQKIQKLFNEKSIRKSLGRNYSKKIKFNR